MTLPFAISLPHASLAVPEECRASMALGPDLIWESMDHGTSEIFSDLPAAATIKAEWNRLVVDLNRSPEDKDAKGVVAQRDYAGRDIFLPGHYPDPNQFAKRLVKYHKPYHQKLSQALSDKSIKVLFDCHSLRGKGPKEAPDRGMPRADITLGNNGAKGGAADPERGVLTCPTETFCFMAKCFEDQGLSVSLNQPYAGGYITRHYGALLAEQGRMAVQIEVNKKNYMLEDETIMDQDMLNSFAGKVKKALFAISEGI
jgi:N-formylglutamate amidohydrolase